MQLKVSVTKSSTETIFYTLINDTPGVSGIYLGPYNAITITTNYGILSYRSNDND